MTAPTGKAPTGEAPAERPRFSLDVTAAPDHIDELGHVNNAVYVGWIQDVATSHWYAVAPPEAQERYIWVVTRHEIDYHQPTIAGETVTLSTWVGEPKGARFDRFVEIHGPDGGLRVAARTWWALLDRDLRRPLRIREEMVRPFL
ncbi:thioesterase [Pacificimonas flava]|uniref:Thioesterase n=2 Tax=Pacificimonas TaxID=1960290 RepID=A0A219B5X7_9SPHN|nr:MULTISPECIES: acyl-CoA thioesterase [Pacificimonas]MBZ6377054.1 acyl-CoA thioesterase [Pacificimonas aurantium]OWV33209.1 thioesterase [Pacificimonas flava]